MTLRTLDEFLAGDTREDETVSATHGDCYVSFLNGCACLDGEFTADELAKIICAIGKLERKEE